MLSREVSTAGGRSLGRNNAPMHGGSIRFSTPPRCHNASPSDDTELTVLTAGIFSAQGDMATCHAGCTGLDRTSAARPLQCKGNGSHTTIAASSADLSPRQHGCGNSFASSILAECDSPCSSPHVGFTRLVSGRCSFAKPIFGGSLPSIGALSYKMADGAMANQSSSALHGMSRSLSVIASEAEEDVTVTSAESVIVTSAVEPQATLRSLALAASDARPPSSPSFTYFPSCGGGVSQETSTSTSDKGNTVGRVPAPRLSSVRSIREGCGTFTSSNNSTERKFFEPLQLDSSGHLFSPLRRLSGVHSSQGASCVPTRESCGCDCGGAPVRPKDVRLGCPFSTVHHEKLCDIVKQQQLLHACLVSIARERSEMDNLPRLGNLSFEKAPRQSKPRRCRRLMSIMWLLCNMFLRLPLRMMKRVLTASVCEARKRFLVTHKP